MRLAIVSTPRSGNTWVRSVLREALALQEIAVHNPRDIGTLSDRVILQIHWYREPNFQEFLRANGFRVIVLARHPFDVLVSAWHFAPFEPSTARWLEGNTDISRAHTEQPPASDAFLSYATSWGAENLLSISYQWWHDANSIKVRYEDLVDAPAVGFNSLITHLGGEPRDLSSILSSYRLAFFQDHPNRHGWRAQPGLWRKLIDPGTAFRIWYRHRRVFNTLGYGVPISAVNRRQARRNWERLRVSTTASRLQRA